MVFGISYPFRLRVNYRKQALFVLLCVFVYDETVYFVQKHGISLAATGFVVRSSHFSERLARLIKCNKTWSSLPASQPTTFVHRKEFNTHTALIWSMGLQNALSVKQSLCNTPS